jgi:protein-arginine kinase activator protein McsA
MLEKILKNVKMISKAYIGNILKRKNERKELKRKIETGKDTLKKRKKNGLKGKR